MLNIDETNRAPCATPDKLPSDENVPEKMRSQSGPGTADQARLHKNPNWKSGQLRSKCPPFAPRRLRHNNTAFRERGSKRQILIGYRGVVPRRDDLRSELWQNGFGGGKRVFCVKDLIKFLGGILRLLLWVVSRCLWRLNADVALFEVAFQSG